MSAIEVRPNPPERLEVRSKGGMLVAVTTATVRGEEGEPERLTAGVSRVDARHWLVERYPHLFGRERVTAGARRSKPTRATARSLSLPEPWNPLVRLDTEAVPTFTVRLTHAAYLVMGDQAYAQRGEIETGGALFGHPARDQDDSVRVKRAGDPGPATRSSRNRMTVDMAQILREAEALNESGSSIGWIGFWHTTQPSTATSLPITTSVASRTTAASCETWAAHRTTTSA